MDNVNTYRFPTFLFIDNAFEVDKLRNQTFQPIVISHTQNSPQFK